MLTMENLKKKTCLFEVYAQLRKKPIEVAGTAANRDCTNGIRSRPSVTMVDRWRNCGLQGLNFY